MQIISQCPVEIFNAIVVSIDDGNKDAGVVYQHIQAAEASNGQINTGVSLHFFAHIPDLCFSLDAPRCSPKNKAHKDYEGPHCASWSRHPNPVKQ